MKRLLGWMGVLVSPLAVTVLTCGMPGIILLVLAVAQNNLLLFLLAFIVPGLLPLALQNIIF